MSQLADQMQAHALEAQRFTRKHLVVELDYSPASLQELDAQADAVDYALAGGKSEENLAMLTRIWGSYVGEMLRRHAGGQWVSEQSPEGPRIALQGEKQTVYPHEQVRRRLTDGPQHCLAEYFENTKNSL
jgi:hypothetical protein